MIPGHDLPNRSINMMSREELVRLFLTPAQQAEARAAAESDVRSLFLEWEDTTEEDTEDTEKETENDAENDAEADVEEFKG